MLIGCDEALSFSFKIRPVSCLLMLPVEHNCCKRLQACSAGISARAGTHKYVVQRACRCFSSRISAVVRLVLLVGNKGMLTPAQWSQWMVWWLTLALHGAQAYWVVLWVQLERDESAVPDRFVLFYCIL